MSEIEKEINRRFQNKNIKKAGLPYRAPGETMLDASGKPSLNQLRSSFTPPMELPPSSATPQMASPSTQMPSSASVNGFFIPQQHANAVNGTSGAPMMPHGFAALPSHPYGHRQDSQMFPHSGNGPNGLPGYVPSQQQQQQFYASAFQQSAPVAAPSVMPPATAISPEMAAALLQQLQQQNPALLESILGKQPSPSNTGSNTNAEKPINPQKTSNASALPPPPSSNVTVRRSNTGTARQHASASRTPSAASSQAANWPVDENAAWNELMGAAAAAEARRNGSVSSNCSAGSASGVANGDDKENNHQPLQEQPVWQMRDSYLKRLQREEMRNKEIMDENEDSEAVPSTIERSPGLTADDDEEETDKLIKRDHNEVVEEEIKSKKTTNGSVTSGGSNKKEGM
jgi:hypothetical protein